MHSLALLVALALAAVAVAERTCPKCHERWPDRYLSCPMDGTRTAPLPAARTPAKKALPRATFGRVFDEGLAAFRAKDYRKAAAAFARASEADPSSAPAVYWRGRSLVSMDKSDPLAKVLFERAIRMDPGYAPPHTNLGIVLRVQKRYAEAEAEYRTAILINPKDPGTHYNLGNVLYDQKRYAEAEAEYRTAIKIDPQDADAHHNLGNVLYDQNHYVEAEAEYRTAILIDPQYAYAHSGLGYVLWKQRHDYAGAESEFRRALEIHPDDPFAKDNLDAMLKEKAGGES